MRTPTILQVETGECGIACLAMVASYHQGHCPLDKARAHVGSNSLGMTLKDLSAAAGKLGLGARPIKCDLDDLLDLRLPAILHWQFDHYVVLTECSRFSCVIHDPAQGRTRLRYREVSRSFTGVAIEFRHQHALDAGPVIHRGKTRRGISDVLTLDASLVKGLTQLLCLAVLAQAAAVIAPLYVQLVIDDVLLRWDTRLLPVLAIGFAGVALISQAINWLRAQVALHLGYSLSESLSVSLFEHLIHLPLGYFERRHMGDVVSRFGSLSPVRDFLTTSVTVIIVESLMLVTMLTLIFWLSPVAGWIAVGSIAILLSVYRAMFERLKQRSHEQIVADADQNAGFMDAVRQMSVIKRYGHEPLAQSTWHNQFARSINAGVFLGKLQINLDAMRGLVTGLTMVAMVYCLARDVQQGYLTVGMLYVLLNYRNYLSAAVEQLVQEYINWTLLSVHLERIADIHASEREAAHPQRLNSPDFIRVNEAAFAYDGLDNSIFSGINLEVFKGESLAIVGPSGCGKTTLVMAIMGLSPLIAGRIEAGPQLINPELRSKYQGLFSSVMQSDNLLPGTIESNIVMRDPQPNLVRLFEVSELVELHEDINQLPLAYDSMVGEMGTALSAGQRQRLLIARALYQDNPVLLLDEGTAHLDEAAERRLMERLLRLPDKIVIFITHNPEIARIADHVLEFSGNGCARQVDAADFAGCRVNGPINASQTTTMTRPIAR